MTPNANTWDTQFRELFDRSCEKYRSGSTDFASYYTEDDLSFLGSIGYRKREFFDFVEDYCNEGVPTAESALLVAAARRDYFLVVQDGASSEIRLLPDALPGKEEEFAGLVWLPRILAKARGKLRGELDPDIMFCCGGDRAFLKRHGIHPADFLRATWAAEADDEQLIRWVQAQSTDS